MIKFYIFTIMVIYWSSYCLGKEIQMPPTVGKDDVEYLADRLGLNLVYSNFRGIWILPPSNVFSVDDADLGKLFGKYQEVNKDRKVHYDSATKTLFCSDVLISPQFDAFLKSEVILNKQRKLQVKISGKTVRLLFGGCSKDREELEKKYIDNWERIFPQPPTAKDLIYYMLVPDKRMECHINIQIPYNWTKKDEEDNKNLLHDIQERLNDKQLSKADKRHYEEIIEILKRPVKFNQDSLEITITYRDKKPSQFWDDPSFEELAEVLKTTNYKLLRTRFRSPNLTMFFTAKYTIFNTTDFLKVLLGKGVFNHPPDNNSFVQLIPNYLQLSKNYHVGVQYLLDNIDKISSKKMQKYWVSCIGSDGNNRKYLDEQSLKKLLNLAHEFKLERIYTDTSKWIGDDLPEDYDRWQNFKVSDTELVFERDKTIGKTNYHLKFFKYKEPVKIGGIPLKKMEEADYSTPEKACFSCYSERTFEWSKISVYGIDDYSGNDFDLYNQWKRWHSGFNPFVLVPYKVEITQSGEKRQDSPDLFLLERPLDGDNWIGATPMKLDGKNWKFYISCPAHIDALGDYIKEEILKFDPNPTPSSPQKIQQEK